MLREYLMRDGHLRRRDSYGHYRLVNLCWSCRLDCQQNHGNGCATAYLLNIIVEVTGAFIGSFLWGLLTNHPEPYGFFDMRRSITAILGSSILLYLLRLVSGRERV